MKTRKSVVRPPNPHNMPWSPRRTLDELQPPEHRRELARLLALSGAIRRYGA